MNILPTEGFHVTTYGCEPASCSIRGRGAPTQACSRHTNLCTFEQKSRVFLEKCIIVLFEQKLVSSKCKMLVCKIPISF